MKNIVKVILMVSLCTSIFCGCTSISNLDNNKIMYNYNDVKDILIRFHVIANSDNEEDQKLKLKVRDKVIEFYYPLLKESKSLEQSRKIIKDNMIKAEEIAKKIVIENGYNYTVKSELSHENFPEKEYGNIVLPQGEYEAYRIIIGEGEGHNWWCVMFPPLCFIDVTKGKVQEEESEKELDSYVEESKQEHGEVNKGDEEKETKIKFKIVEIFEDLFK